MCSEVQFPGKCSIKDEKWICIIKICGETIRRLNKWEFFLAERRVKPWRWPCCWHMCTFVARNLSSENFICQLIFSLILSLKLPQRFSKFCNIDWIPVFFFRLQFPCAKVSSEIELAFTSVIPATFLPLQRRTCQASCCRASTGRAFQAGRGKVDAETQLQLHGCPETRLSSQWNTLAPAWRQFASVSTLTFRFTKQISHLMLLWISRQKAAANNRGHVDALWRERSIIFNKVLKRYLKPQLFLSSVLYFTLESIQSTPHTDGCSRALWVSADTYIIN